MNFNTLLEKLDQHSIEVPIVKSKGIYEGDKAVVIKAVIQQRTFPSVIVFGNSIVSGGVAVSILKEFVEGKFPLKASNGFSWLNNQKADIYFEDCSFDVQRSIKGFEFKVDWIHSHEWMEFPYLDNLYKILNY